MKKSEKMKGKNLTYKAYAKENLITITVVCKQNDKQIKECYTFIRFAKGFNTDNNKRSYNTNQAIVIKFNLLEFASLGKALKFASFNNGNSTYVKYANTQLSKDNEDNSKKKVTLKSQYLNASSVGNLIGTKFTRYEMEAIADDIEQMVKIANKELWNGQI